MTTERKAGWYHVKTGVGWECARWELGRWYIAGTGHAYADADFEEIGDRIPAPGEGWRCVPVEMTPGMRRSGQHAQEHQCYIDGIYADIIAAAPRP